MLPPSLCSMPPMLYLPGLLLAMDLRCSCRMVTIDITSQTRVEASAKLMNTPVSGSKTTIASQPSRDAVPRRLIVTAGVVIFAIRDWSLWALLRDSPWGPPMRLVLGTESVTDAVDRTVEAVLMWPSEAALFQLKAGWQEIGRAHV